jgi:hypothetical protein
MILAGAVLAAFLAASSHAVPLLRDAKRLALGPSDFPPAAKRMSEKENRAASLPGGSGQAYTTTFQFRHGRRTEAVTAIVITAPSAAVAARVYTSAVAGAKGDVAAPLRLSSLGDRQFAFLHGRPRVNETSGVVWVLRNTVVWSLQVSSVQNPFGFSRVEALAELSAYGAKQKRRVGAG